MDNHRLIRRLTAAAVSAAAFLALTVLFALMLGSCTTTKYVPQPYPVPEVHETHTTDTIRETVKDSTTTRREGDTVFVDHWHDRWRDRWHENTVHDSIPYPVPEPYPVEVEKPYYSEKEMPWHKKTAMYAGYAALLLLAIKTILRRWKG